MTAGRLFGRTGVIGLVLLAATAATLLLVDQETSAGPNEQPTAETIMQERGPTGQQLADSLGLVLQKGFTGNCSYFAEINDSHEGYCLEGLEGDNHAKQWVIAEALRGQVVTQEDFGQVVENLTEQGGLYEQPS